MDNKDRQTHTVWSDGGEYVSDEIKLGEGFQKGRVVLRGDRFSGCVWGFVHLPMPGNRVIM